VPGLDLRSLRPRLDDLLLIDQCRIWSDPGGSTDDVTDPVTGSVTAAGETLVGEPECLLKPTYRMSPVTEGGQPRAVSYYELYLSGDSDLEIHEGDRLVMISSVHAPHLVDRRLRIAEVLGETVTLFRRFRVEFRERQRDRP
jgi:Family of unknown function (DUF6093)